MWNSINGMSFMSGYGLNSPFANTMNMPYGSNSFGSFGGLAYDMYTPQNSLPLKSKGKTFWEEIPEGVKVIGGLLIASYAAFKVRKLIKNFKQAPKQV